MILSATLAACAGSEESTSSKKAPAEKSNDIKEESDDTPVVSDDELGKIGQAACGAAVTDVNPGFTVRYVSDTDTFGECFEAPKPTNDNFEPAIGEVRVTAFGKGDAIAIEAVTADRSTLYTMNPAKSPDIDVVPPADCS